MFIPVPTTTDVQRYTLSLVPTGLLRRLAYFGNSIRRKPGEPAFGVIE
jgi:hypothetical protein